MKKGQIYEGIIERVDICSGGRTVCYCEKWDSGTEDPFYDKQV